MTESRVVIEIINRLRLRYCLGYNTIEAFETDLVTQISDKREALHDGLTPTPDLGILLAWDNYNEFSVYLSGGGMINYTEGICYQFTVIRFPCDNQQEGTV